MIQRYLVIFLLSLSLFTINGYSQTTEDTQKMFEQANNHFSNGEYKEAINIYDEILGLVPSNISTLKMKGIALSNLGYHEQSMKQFFKVLQHRPGDTVSLTGLGVGFGNLGEYQEAKKYFEIALDKKPESIVIKNYKEYVDKVIAKYPYTPTEKPDSLVNFGIAKIPEWVKPMAQWWSERLVEDSEFVDALKFLIEKKIIQVPEVEAKTASSEKIPGWVRDNASWWAQGQINDKEFVSGIQYLMENGIIIVKIERTQKEIFEKNQREFTAFETYLRKISNNVAKEKRYIEDPNPSGDVIKKFLRDYIKWNFEQEAKSASKNFPDPTYEVIDDTYVIRYKVFVNEQPSGLPLDHVGTLKNSFGFWENQELEVNNQAAKVEFEITDKKHEANVWATWVVRELGEGVLGHAHLGKGIVEVTLGDYNCDGSFQLYDVKSVEKIMTHELGHSIGLPHITEQNNIMYPSMQPSYAYCLLS